MEIEWNRDVLDLRKLQVVTRGDTDKLKQYLMQFRELIPTRISLLKRYLQEEDRKMIRQTVHQVSPQLHYFGLREVAPLIERVESAYTTMSMDELKRTVESLIDKMETAEKEVGRVLETCD